MSRAKFSPFAALAALLFAGVWTYPASAADGSTQMSSDGTLEACDNVASAEVPGDCDYHMEGDTLVGCFFFEGTASASGGTCFSCPADGSRTCTVSYAQRPQTARLTNRGQQPRRLVRR